jgi:hypothetical protein
MQTIPRPDGYIITGLPPDGDGVTESDPYQTRAEAESDRRGMERFIEADRKNDTVFIHGEQKR